MACLTDFSVFNKLKLQKWPLHPCIFMNVALRQKI